MTPWKAVAALCVLTSACGDRPLSDTSAEAEAGADADLPDDGDALTGFEGWFGTYHTEDRLDVDIIGEFGAATNITFLEDGMLTVESTRCDGVPAMLGSPVVVEYRWELIEPGLAQVQAIDGAVPFPFFAFSVNEVTLRPGEDCNELLVEIVTVDLPPGMGAWQRGAVCLAKCEDCMAPSCDPGTAFPLLSRYEYCDGPPPPCSN